MRKFKTENRLEKITNAVKARQYSLKLVLENIHDPHNVSAIYRTCDAAGVPKVTLLYNVEKFPKVSMITSASAFKWIETERYSNAEECFSSLKKEGFRILATKLSKNAKDIHEIDFTKKTAIVLGNENRGISEEVEEMADELIYIPMYGMVQSLNVSVSNAVILYEALRQRKAAGMYDESELPLDELEKKIDEWSAK